MLRLKGPFFAIGMFGLARVLEAFALGFDSITGGGTGIYLKPVSDLRPIYYAVAAVAFVMLLLTWKLDNSRLGLKLLAIREDESAAESLGIPTTRLKIGTFVASAIAPAAMGSIYAVYLGFIDPPTAFAPNMELTTIAMVLLGGMGTVLGPLVGCAGALGRQRSAVGELSANLSRLCRRHRAARRAVHAARHRQSRHEERLAQDRPAAVPVARRARGTGGVMSDNHPCRRERLEALCRPHRARFRQHRRGARLDHGHDRSERLRQVDAVQHHRRHASSRRGPRAGRTAGASPRPRLPRSAGLASPAPSRSAGCLRK